MSEQSMPVPVTVVQGREVSDFPELAPEAARGRVLRVTVTGEQRGYRGAGAEINREDGLRPRAGVHRRAHRHR
jgi:peptide deformylase